MLIYPWSAIQPTSSDSFDWSNVILNLNLVKAADVVRAAATPPLPPLHVGLAIIFGRSYPGWLKTKGVYFFTLDIADNGGQAGQAGDLPLPWDATLIGYEKACIAALAAQFDGDSTVSYIRASVGQQVLAFNFVGTSNATQTLSDGVTNSSSNVLASAGAHWVSTDIGLTLTGAAFRSNTQVQSITDPTHVVMTKTAGASGSSQTFNIEGRLVGQGDDYKLDQLAAHHPGGYAGLASDYADATPAGITPAQGSGYASSVAILATAQSLSDYWASQFHRTTLTWTYSVPFPRTNPWTVQVATTASTYARTADHFGGFYNGAQARPSPYPSPVAQTFSHGEQAIHPSSFPDIYAPPTPSPYPAAPQPLIDLLEGVWRGSGGGVGNGYVELYPDDLNNPAYASALGAERTLMLAHAWQP
jgi:hypothetical protein